MVNERRARLERFFNSQNLDALLFTGNANIRYLSGFSGSEGVLLISRDSRAYFLCDSRYTEQAGFEVIDSEIIQFSEKNRSIGELAAKLDLKRIGFESTRMPVADFTSLGAHMAHQELVPVGSELDQIRSVKDAGEIERLEQVAALASEAFLATIEIMKPGITEAAFAFALEYEIRRRGADGRAFDYIVAAGERGALPHGRASARCIRANELVTVDFGALMNGYHSDETATVAVGCPEPRVLEIYEVVKEAHDRALAAVKPGMTCRDIDAIARDYIRDCGFGDFFGHGLGHGVGLEIHEKPTLSPRSNMMVEVGMVFTIEPGIYIPQLGGVRIEDTIIVHQDGARPLTRIPKELIHV